MSERVPAGKPRAAVVVGSGFGGLAAGVRLAARGWDVTLLERHDQPGGRARVFRQDGFTFDAGPTVITAPALFEELWTLCGKSMRDSIDLRPVTPFYRIRFDDGGVFDYTADPAAMRAQIRAIEPGDIDGYERFLAMSARIYAVGFEKLAHVPFGSWRAMARAVPDMVVLESYRTVYGLVSRFVQNDKIRQVLSFHPLLVGGNPFTTTSIYSLIPHLERVGGVHFPMGGTGSLVRGLVDLLEGRGGRIRYGVTVDEILVDDGGDEPAKGQRPRVRGVKLASGEVVPADVVVSNADSAYTYRRLVPARFRRRWTDARLRRARYSMSLFVWYFGTDRIYGDVAHHSILLGPRYKELLDDIFARKVLAPDFSLYLHRPTETDPSLAPPGCDAFYVLSPVPHLDAGVDWASRAEPYRRSIERHLENTVLPGLSKHVVTSRTMTPVHFRDELLSERGAAFGLEPVLTQSAYFRPHNASDEIDGLFLVGAGTHPGAGVPGVLSSARVLDSFLLDPRPTHAR